MPVAKPGDARAADVQARDAGRRGAAAFKLALVRDLCEQLEASLDSWLASLVPADRHRAMTRKMWRPSPLHSSAQNIEPWAADCKQDRPEEPQKAIGCRRTANAWPTTCDRRPQPCADRWPTTPSSRCWRAASRTASSVAAFCCRLIELAFDRVINAPKPDKGSEDDIKMADWIAKAMLQSEAAISAVGFVAHSAAACESLRAGDHRPADRRRRRCEAVGRARAGLPAASPYSC
jgi:hypothetical protein